MAIFARSYNKASRIALAAAIMSIGAFGVTAVDAPAFAQKKKDQKDERQFSDGFRAAFGPVQEAANAKDADQAALLDMIVATEGAVSTADDKMVFGNHLYVTARNVENLELAGKGMELMLESGKVPQESLAEYNFVAGQIALANDKYPLARQRLQRAAELGYENPENGADIDSLMAETYTRANDPVGGLQYTAEQINSRIKAGEVPKKALVDRGFVLAYKNSMPVDAANFALLGVKYYPSTQTWRNAIAVQRNYTSWEDPEVLDLMRLMHATGTMAEAREYIDYIDAADFQRLPAEVVEVAEEGVSKGVLSTSDAMIEQVLAGGRERAPLVRADLAALARDAKASGASGSLAMSAGNVHLSAGEAAAAAELFEVALTRPDADRATALTRLGIAQVESGDYAAAQETLAKVQGKREPIAKLWAAYAAQLASGSPTAS